MSDNLPAMHARLDLDPDSRLQVRMPWTLADVLALRAVQHRVCSELAQLHVREHGHFSLRAEPDPLAEPLPE